MIRDQNKPTSQSDPPFSARATVDENSDLRLDFFGDLIRDFRTAARAFRKSSGFTAAAVASLAIGIGASTVIFSIVNAVMLRPLPFPEAERLVILKERTPQGGRFSTSEPNFLDFRERSESLADLAAIAYPPPRLSLRSGGEPVQLMGDAVTGSFFDILGVEPALGRTFTWEETSPGSASEVVVLGHGAWQRHFGTDPDIVGSIVLLSGQPHTVLGVMPPGFKFQSRAEVWVPFVPDPQGPRGDRRLEAVGKLGESSTIEAARDELSALASQLAGEHPESNRDWGLELIPLADWILGPDVRRTNLVLLVAVGLLLLLACANVSNLLIARATRRQGEIALRLTLGASRGRIVRQLLTESLLLAFLGSASGVLLAFWGIPMIRSLGPDALPRIEQMSIDSTVLAFALLISVSAGLLFGLAPALQASSRSLTPAFRSGVRASARSSRLRQALVAAELALALMLAIGAGLLFHSFHRLQRVDPGFDTENLLTVELTLPEDRYSEGGEETGIFYSRVLERLSGLGAVSRAGASMVNPFVGPAPSNEVGTATAREQGEFVRCQWRSVSPSFFSTLGIPLLAGREFEDNEQEFAAIVNRSLADRLWPGEDPIGKPVRWINPEGPLPIVVGVVGNAQDLRPREGAPPTFYFHASQVTWRSMTLLIKTEIDPEAISRDVLREIRAVDDRLGAPPLSTVSENLRAATAGPRLNVEVMGLFAVIALLIAAIGIYGIVSFAVAQRRQEIGIRMALGARPGSVARLILSQGLRLLAYGTALGLAGAVALGRLLASLLYETPPLHFTTFLAVTLVLAAVSTAACWGPAWRAANLDSVSALKGE